MRPKATAALSVGERLNFLLTNRLPRAWMTALIGRISRCRQPLIAQLSIRMLQLFGGDLRLHEARRQRFETLQDCFIRELRPGVRPIDPAPDVLVSPCDGEVMAAGGMAGQQLIQAKGLTYTLGDLLGDDALAARYAHSAFATLRLRATMYHRFHAPEAGRLDEIRHIGGDCWNVNPPAVKAVERLYCRNVRAVLPLHLNAASAPLLVVPVAALGVSSLCIHGLGRVLNGQAGGSRRLPCYRRVSRGDELGYFLQGSTIVVVAPPGHAVADGLAAGQVVRVGQRLLQRVPAAA